MNNLNERIHVFADKNKDHGITSTGGYLIQYEKISHDRFGYPRYLLHYSDLGLRQYDSIIGRVTGLKKYRGKTKGDGLYTLTSFSLAEDLEQIILTIKDFNEINDILSEGGEN